MLMAHALGSWPRTATTKGQGPGRIAKHMGTWSFHEGSAGRGREEEWTGRGVTEEDVWMERAPPTHRPLSSREQACWEGQEKGLPSWLPAGR